MLIGARVFVSLVYGILGLSFVASTAVMIWEFQSAGWLDHLTTHSHLFLFFPTFGIVALVAFFSPAAALSDLYWHHIKFGKARFIAGFVGLLGFSYVGSLLLLASPQRSAWEIAPPVLLADRGVPASCGGPDAPCERLSVIAATANLRAVSQSRFGLAELVPGCAVDPLLEVAPGSARRRFCFALSSLPSSGQPGLVTDAECCRAQARLRDAVNTWHLSAEKRSLTSWVHALLLPLKVFFLLNLLALSVLLAWRHQRIIENYEPWLGRVEVGLLAGTAAALFFPFMSQAFVLSSSALFGVAGQGTFSTLIPALSIAFGLWTLLIVLYFYRRGDREVEQAAKIVSAAASVVAVLRYDVVVALFVRGANSGADLITLGAVVVACVAAVVAMIGPWGRQMAERQLKLSRTRSAAKKTVEPG